MPWCPNCRYEYRPEVKECPECQAALVNEPPAQDAGNGSAQDSKIDSLLRDIRCYHPGFRSGLTIARESLGIILRAYKLLLVVFLLIIAVSSLNLYHLLVGERAAFNRKLRLAAAAPAGKRAALGLWFADTINITTLKYPLPFILKDANTPLYQVISAPQAFTNLLVPSDWYAESYRRQYLSYSHEESDRQEEFLWLALFPFGKGVFDLIFSTFVFATILCWLSVLAKAPTAKPFWTRLTVSYLRLLVLYVSLCVIRSALAYLLTFNSINSYPEALNYSHYHIFNPWIYPVALLLLCLAPFALVNRNLRIWSAIKAGVLLLWHRRWAFLAILLCYRLAYELINIGSLAFPMRFYYPYAFDLWRNYLTSFPQYLAFALLGLWLAMCFILLVMPKAENADAPEGSHALVS
jgi:hypothetical protein